MIKENHPSCRLCGEDMIFDGLKYFCEFCDEIIENIGGSLR